MRRKTLAAICRERRGPFVLEQVELDEPRPDEVLVRIQATGICHTDVLVREGAYPVPLPIVLGHEGAGVVEAVGDAVEGLVPGDNVVLTYRSCETCSSCLRGRPGYCRNIFELTYGGGRPDGSSPISQAGRRVGGDFFGQSSFAGYAMAHGQNAVKVRADVPPELAGPLGCGIQTGYGAVVESLGVRPGDTVVVLGTGPVGLSAILAAAHLACSKIVAVDILAPRLQLALELGATATVQSPVDGGLTDTLREIEPDGFQFAIDTTGRPEVGRAAVDALSPMGVFGLVGGSPLGTEVSLDMNTMLFGGRSFRGIIGGDAIPKLMIPRLADLVATGRLPMEKLTTTYPLEAINEAVADTQSGRAVKAVVMPE